MDETVAEIPVDLIIVGEFNPRKFFDLEHIRELSGSIKRDGQWNPIIVKKNSKGYDLIAGECRLRATQKLGYNTIKARILDIDDEEAYLLALKTNVLRRDMNPIEEGFGIKKLIDKGWSINRVSKELNKSKSWVYLREKLFRTSSDGLKNALIQKIIPLTYAIEISKLPEGLQGPVVEKTIRHRLNFKEVSFLVDLLKGARTPEELESILKAPREKIMKWFISGNPPFKGLEKPDMVFSTIECSCGSKFIVDWKNHKMVSEENYRGGRILSKTLRFLRGKR